MDVGGWLRSLGLGQYEAAFRANEIDDKVLPNLTPEDLKELGISAIGHRRAILTAIAELAGASLPSEKAPSAALVQDSAERRHLTVMFCDLVGSTALSSRLDPEDMRAVIRAYQVSCSGIIARYDGFVAKFMGDGLLAYFGYPRAHGDDAERAVRAGLEITDMIPKLETRANEKLQTRTGIATGLVVVGDLVGEGSAREQAVVGDTPNLAARLQGLAAPETVVVAGTTRRLLGDFFALHDLGPQTIKGLVVPVEAWRVDGISSSESRFEAARAARLTDFVGRETESVFLLDRLAIAWKGQGQVVLISGEAGIGKSRFAAWLAERVAQDPHTRLRYQCSPYHRDSALYPFVVQLERAAQINPEDAVDQKLDKLEAALAPATGRLKDTAPLFASLLSIAPGTRYPPLAISPAQQRRQTLAALLDQLEGLARLKPILALFEDVHWADATTLEVLNLAVERVRHLPVLMLVTFRPEFGPPWTGLPSVTSLALGRLDKDEVEALVKRVAGGRTLPAEVIAQIVAKTDGVPLFVEELTKTVQESGLLIEAGDGYRLSGPLQPFAIPATLQDSLMARLDRLAPVKEIAQIGAAIGREFSYQVMSAIAGRDEATLNSALTRLEEAELLFRAGTLPDARYAFKHALVQDAAYESMLKSRRQVLHKRIAETLCDQFPAIAAAQPEVLAHHFTQAGVNEAAIEWWGKAGDQALRRSAFKEAIAHLRKAIELADKSIGSETAPSSSAARSERLRLQTNYGQALLWAHGHAAAETNAAFTRARELASQVDNATERFSAYYGLWVGAYTRGEIGLAQEMASLFLRELESQPHLPEACVGHRILGATCWYTGDFAGAHHHLEKALGLYDRTVHCDFANRFGQDVGVSAGYFDAMALFPLGHVDEAIRRVDQARSRAEATAHVPTLIQLHFWRFFLGAIRRRPDWVAADVRTVSALVAQHNVNTFVGYTTFAEGWMIWALGERDLGTAEMLKGIRISRDNGYRLCIPFYEAAVAEAEAQAGHIDAALARSERALAEIEETGEHWCEAEMHRIHAGLMLQRDPTDIAPAEEVFHKAIAIAKAQEARSFELRAALGLAKLYHASGRVTDAYAALKPAVEGFVLSPEFPEVQEAQRLLAI